MPIDNVEQGDRKMRHQAERAPSQLEGGTTRVGRTSWKQVSLRRVLVVVMLAAFAISGFAWLTDENPTDSIPGFEKARAFHGSTATIGPNQIRIKSIVRNQVNGPLIVESREAGSTSASEVPRAAELTAAAPWLDVVQVELIPGTDLLDVLELRVFDHATRQSLVDDHPWCGFRVANPNLIHLYAIGSRFPGAVDLWLRVHSYDKSDPVLKLPPRLYASAMIDDFVVTITEAQTGYRGWSSSDGLMPVQGTNHSECAFVLEWEGPQSEVSYQVAAYSKSGLKFFHDLRVNPHLFGGSKIVVDFPVPLDQIDHLEIRRHGGRHRFYFDGVEIPALKGPRSFAKPPTAIRKVNGETPQTWELKEFRPLRVHLGLYDGDPFSGSASGSGMVMLTRDENGVQEIGRALTLTTEIDGLANVNYVNRYQLQDDRWRAGASLSNRSAFRASAACREVKAETFLTPLKDLKRIEISFDP